MLSVNPIEIPLENIDEFIQELLNEGIEIIRETDQWKHGRRYGEVDSKNGKRPGQEYGWHARQSFHDLSWEVFRDNLLWNHSVNEQEYIPDHLGSKQIKVIQPGLEVWQISYKLPGILSNRDFLEGVLMIDHSQHSSDRVFYVISFPVKLYDISSPPGFERGTYASVEEVREIGVSKVRWT